MSELQAEADDTGVGSYFVANYPPFSVWTPAAVRAEALPALERVAPADVPLGLYLHIPFCRKRCHFCYFRVYTDKNAQEVQQYLDALAREWERIGTMPAVADRAIDFVYFGGGTPSFLSTRQLEGLVRRLSLVKPWSSASEITFECEPGTLTEAKLAAIRQLGVTRLSLGVESFDDQILEANGRAHRSAEIERAYRCARSLAFPQINIDLIAGMLGETDRTWHESIRRTLAFEPDSVTIYQMELPFNTTISADRLRGAGRFDQPLASWSTKRRWVAEAFDALEATGYRARSAYTLVKRPETRFVYTDRLWEGADLVGLGVASFGHVNGVHMQNLDTWDQYSAAVDRGELPLGRAYRPTADERLIREFVLQLKRGVLSRDYFRRRHEVDVLERFEEPIRQLVAEGYATLDANTLCLSREALLRVDVLLRRFFRPEHVDVRYT